MNCLPLTERHIFSGGCRINEEGLIGRVRSSTVELVSNGHSTHASWFSYFRLPGYATIMQGEFKGIEDAAIRLASTIDNTLRKAIVYSDSQTPTRAVIKPGKLESVCTVCSGSLGARLSSKTVTSSSG